MLRKKLGKQANKKVNVSTANNSTTTAANIIKT